MTRRCIAVLGGSFDPVHNGHVALGRYFSDLLQADALQVVPAGNPWQKPALHASPADRLEMVRLAFMALALPVTVDAQEIERGGATYTIDTLRALRAAYGPETSIVFLIGADQLQQLDSWREWRALFDVAHVCAASRPGFLLDQGQVAPAVLAQFARCAGSPGQMRATPHGLAHIATDLAVDVSATAIRALLANRPHGRNAWSDELRRLVPTRVLDYIEQHNLYKN